MHDDSPRPAPGSSRRRPRNNPVKHTPQRNYASENDMSNVQARLPQTPQKSESSSPAPAAGNQPSSRRVGRDKGPARNLPLSPDSARTTRQTSHPTSIPRAGAAGAFAGATFHASPAPSSLPLPSFLSKGVDSPTVDNGANLGRPASSQAAAASMPTPSRASPSKPTEARLPTPSHASPSPVARDSPLEFMFKADREEKEQARRARQAPTDQQKKIDSALSISQSPTRRGTTQFGVPHSPSPIRYGRPDVDMPTPEFGHRFGKSIGPSFSTSYQERIRAAKNSHPPNPPKDGSWEPVSPPSDATDRSEALKRYIFGTSNIGESGKIHAGPEVPVAPSATPQASRAENQEHRDEEVVTMENNLRRMLNLDSSLMTRHPVHQSQ